MRKKVIEVEKIVKLIKHARFYVHAGDYNPVGYKSAGLEFKRKRFETTEELRSRCRDSVEWPSIETVHVFVPLQKQP